MKKCLALLLCLILLCAALPASALTDGELQQKLDAAFEADALKLVETTLPICHPAIDDLELSEGLLEYLKQHTDSEDPAMLSSRTQAFAYSRQPASGLPLSSPE